MTKLGLESRDMIKPSNIDDVVTFLSSLKERNEKKCNCKDKKWNNTGEIGGVFN